MKEFKGTPGPWIVGQIFKNNVPTDEDGPGFYAETVYVRDGSNRILAEVKGFATKGFVSPDTVVPNVNLIVAAPALLNALQQLVAINEPGDGYCPEINQAHEAIAKALGE